MSLIDSDTVDRFCMRRTLNLIPLSSPSRNRNIWILSNLWIRSKIKLIICHNHQISDTMVKIANFHSKSLDFFHIAKWMSSTIRNVPLQWVRKRWLAIGSKWNSKCTDYRYTNTQTLSTYGFCCFFLLCSCCLYICLNHSGRVYWLTGKKRA